LDLCLYRLSDGSDEQQHSSVLISRQVGHVNEDHHLSTTAFMFGALATKLIQLTHHLTAITSAPPENGRIVFACPWHPSRVENMEDTLKRLLDAELKAEALVTQAVEEREAIHRQALDEAQLAGQRFEARIPEIRASFMDKARQRVEQSIAEMRLRHDERSHALQSMAEESREDAVQAALRIITDPEA
jgi:vacuolar-type H+-ATPase subunit H